MKRCKVTAERLDGTVPDTCLCQLEAGHDRGDEPTPHLCQHGFRWTDDRMPAWSALFALGELY